METKTRFTVIKLYNKAVVNIEKWKNKHKKTQGKIINYEVGEKVSLRNRESVSYTHLDVYKRQS